MWDMKKLEYRNAEMKNKLWEDLAKDMAGGVTAVHLKAAFKNLRNWYTKLDKDAAKSGTAPRVLTGRDVQVQQRMQFMKNSVTHRPAPMVSSKPGGPTSSQSRELIQSVDNQALLPRSPSSKKRRPSSASASTSADADALEGVQSVLNRNTSTLQQIYSSVQSDDAAVNLDDPLSASRAIHKSFCQYVTTCVMTYDESEFDQFQTSFTLLHERFKAERREVQRRAAAIPHQQTHTATSADTHFGGYPSLQTSSSAPVPFQLYGSQGDSHQYQQDSSQQWHHHPTTQPQGALHSHTPEYNAQYRFLQQERQSARTPRLPPMPQREVTLPPREPPLPNLRRLHSTSTPKRPKPTHPGSADTHTEPEAEPAGELSGDLNFSDFTVPREQDSQQDALDQLEEA